NDRIAPRLLVIGERDDFAKFVTEQRLPDCRLIRNDAAIGIAVPSAEDNISFLLARIGVAQTDYGANGNLRRVRIFERGAPSIVEGAFQFGFAPHQDSLHFLGGLELEILAEIA